MTAQLRSDGATAPSLAPALARIPDTGDTSDMMVTASGPPAGDASRPATVDASAAAGTAGVDAAAADGVNVSGRKRPAAPEPPAIAAPAAKYVTCGSPRSAARAVISFSRTPLTHATRSKRLTIDGGRASFGATPVRICARSCRRRSSQRIVQSQRQAHAEQHKKLAQEQAKKDKDIRPLLLSVRPLPVPADRDAPQACA